MARPATPPERNPPPPYIAYSTFRNFLSDLKATAVPDVIDNSVMPKLSGSDRSQMKMAFRFVAFTDEKNRTQPLLHTLLGDLDTPNWPTALAALLADAYQPVLGNLKLENATPAQLNAKFREARDITGMTLKRAVRFYLMAAKDAGLTVSPLIHRTNGAGGTTQRPRSPRPKKPPTQTLHGTPAVARQNAPTTADRVLDKLPDFDPSWTPDVQKLWFEAMAKVTAMIDGKKQ